jgi:hypothetical protein
MRAACVALAFFGLVAAAPDSWTRVSPPSGSFSVETPCSIAEIDKLKSAPEDFSGFTMPAQGRVICLTPGLILAAAEIGGGEMAAGDPSLYDMIVTEAAKDPKPDGKPVQTTLNGRRAMINRQVDGKVTAQTGFIELGRGRILLVITGFQPDNTTPLAQQGKQIDRFFNSIAVPGQ